MASSEFKTAAAKLLDQNGVKNPVAEVIQAERTEKPANVLQAEMQIPARKVEPIRITVPLILSLAKTRLSLGLAVLFCAGMWLVVPELLIPKSFKIFNLVLGLLMGLTYGVILGFPHNGEGGGQR